MLPLNRCRRFLKLLQCLCLRRTKTDHVASVAATYSCQQQQLNTDQRRRRLAMSQEEKRSIKACSGPQL